jgi:RNA recognition motif-containing protein
MSSVEALTESMAATSIQDHATQPGAGADNGAGGEANNAAQNENVIAVVEEGRRLYIGNLAYATTEGELNDFFKGFLV